LQPQLFAKLLLKRDNPKKFDIGFFSLVTTKSIEHRGLHETYAKLGWSL
jgi:hypothetical protein